MGATHFSGPLVITGLDGADGNGLMYSAGTDAGPATTSIANKNHIEFRFENSATSGDNRGMYLKFMLSGAGGGGESLRALTTVNDVAAGSAHGAHISLAFGTSGTVTGQGIATRSTLHLPTTALTSNVTMSAVQAEIWSDGSTSDPGGSTLLSFLRIINAGDTTGMADVDDDAVVMDLQGFTDGSGNVFYTVSPGTLAASFRVRVGSTLYYVPLYSSQTT